MILTKSPNTTVLFGILRRVKRGEDITYDVLSKAIGTDVTDNTARGWLSSARRAVIRSEKIVFDVKPGVGLHAMTDEELALYIQRKVKRSATSDRRLVRLGACVNAENVKEETLVALAGSMNSAHLSSQMKGPNGVSAIRKALAGNAQPSFADVLAHVRALGSGA